MTNDPFISLAELMLDFTPAPSIIASSDFNKPLDIKHVIFGLSYRGNGEPVLATKVEFTDGTFTVVKNSEHDAVSLTEKSAKPYGNYDVVVADDCSKEAAIAYAWFKRCFGKPKEPGSLEYVSAGVGGKLHKLVQGAYDEAYEEAISKAKKEAKRKANEKAHAEAQRKAHNRKLKALAKRLALEAEAKALIEASTKQPKPLNEDKGEPAPKHTHCNGCSRAYIRPSKPFSQFTQEEKREYWRAQKRAKV